MPSKPKGPRAGHKPPLWSEAKYGSAHGEWESQGLLAPGPNEEPCKKSRVLAVEEALRKSVNSRKDRHDLGRVFLVRVLKHGDHGGPQHPTGRISVEKFIKVLQRKLRLAIMPNEAKALFRKYGHDAQGRLPYELFCRRLFSPQSHIIALEGNRNKPFLADEPSRWGHQGSIKARPNKRGVYAPSDWKDVCMEKCRMSARKPDAYLKLEHVYGYSGLQNTAPNLFYTKRGDVVYYTAAVGIVYNDEENVQKFFLRHTDDIQCLTMHSDFDTVATGQVGAEPIVFIWSAEGVTDRDKHPGPEGREEPIRIKLPYGQRAVQCMGFSKHGDNGLLATVSTDNEHTVNIWNWRDCNVDGVDVPLASGIGKQGTPPQVFCCEWNPFKGTPDAHFSDFITAGKNHIIFWTHDGKETLESEGGAFGSTTQQDVLHVCYLPSGQVLAGGPNGSITVYEEKVAVQEISGAHSSFCQCFKMHGEMLSVLSAGGDGRVVKWTIEAGADPILTKQEVVGADPIKEADGEAPAFVAIDVDPNNPENVIAGSKENDIWVVGGVDEPRVLVEGQSADVFGLAPYPLKPECYASGCEDGAVYIWNSTARQCLKSIQIQRGYEQKPRGCEQGDILKVKAVTFSHDGEFFALSTAGVVDEGGGEEEEPVEHPDKGGVIQVFDIDQEQMFTDDDDMEEEFDQFAFVRKYKRWEFKDTNEVVDDLKFNPSGRFLAVASHDNNIYIYDVMLSFDVKRGGAMVKTGVCRGHSSFVTHIDWSVDGDMIVSNSGDYEQLFWDVGGKQITADVRDVSWATWSCAMGFEVMGIWQDGLDGTDINGVHRSNNGEFTVTCDDYGKIYLFNHPVVIDEAPNRQFNGHSSHVANVRFLHDDTRVVSAGGADRSMMQWKTHGIIAPSSHFRQSKASRAKAKPPVPLATMTNAQGSDDAPDASLSVKLDALKAEHRLNDQTLREQDKQIRYLKQQLSLKAAGIKSVAKSSKSKVTARAPVIVDRKLLEAEYKKVARRGKLKISEFKAFLNNIGFKKSQHVAQRLFVAFDLNKDGELEAEEFITGLTLMTESDSEKKLEFIFRMLDKDGSGAISEFEIRVFMKGFFVLGVDSVNTIANTIEGLVGSTGASDFRADLNKNAESVVKNKTEQLTTEALILADGNADGRIGFDEFREWVLGDDQMFRWIEGMGSYWLSLAQGAADPKMDPRHVKAGKTETRRVNAMKLQEYLQEKMGSIKLAGGDNSLVAALKTAGGSNVDGEGCSRIFETIGCTNRKFSDAVLQIYQTSDGATVDARAIVCGISMLCAATATAAQKLSFAFTIFDADSSGELTVDEVRNFFDMLRIPIGKIIDGSLAGFYELCGYESDFRQVVEGLTEESLKVYIEEVVGNAMELDVNTDQRLDKDEFMMWGHKNRHVGRWIDNLSRFVVGSLETLSVSDFTDDDWV